MERSKSKDWKTVSRRIKKLCDRGVFEGCVMFHLFEWFASDGSNEKACENDDFES